MKSIKLLLIGLAAAFALTGCGDSSKDTPEPEGDGNVVGSWHLVSWSSLQSADVYLSFSESGSFDIYQRLYKPEYVHLDGTYSYDKPTLSGRYRNTICAAEQKTCPVLPVLPPQPRGATNSCVNI